MINSKNKTQLTIVLFFQVI